MWKQDRLTLRRVNNLLRLDADTGELVWRVDRGPRAMAGRVAGTITGKGYRIVTIDGVKYRGHRLVYFIANGVWPSGEVDHVHGDTSDDRPDQLRDVTPSGNQQNRRKAQSNSKTGLLGASWDELKGVFVARIKVGGVNRRIGGFDTAQEAHEAYLAAKRRYHTTCTI